MKKILSKIWKDKALILEGIKNSFFVKDEIEKIAQSRLRICEACPLIDREGSKCFAPGTQPCCGECGCKLAWKTRSLASECPHPDGARWVAVVSQEEEDDLYKDINYNPDKP
jgi:hypothetical protein